MTETLLAQGNSLMYPFLNELSGTEVAVPWRLRSATSVPGSQSGTEVAPCTGPCTEHRLLSGFAWILGCLLTGSSLHLPWTCVGPVWPKCKREWMLACESTRTPTCQNCVADEFLASGDNKRKAMCVSPACLASGIGKWRAHSLASANR